MSRVRIEGRAFFGDEKPAALNPSPAPVAITGKREIDVEIVRCQEVE